MKALNFFKNASLVFILFIAFSASVLAQTPQFYNSSADGTPNSFPFNIAGGKMIQGIIPAGTLINPSPATSGSIVKYYVRIASTGPLGPATYTSFYVAFAQSTITEFSGAFFAGPMDTVYKRASVTLTAAGGSWLEFILDHPFVYDNTKSLIVEIGQCGVTGTFSGFSIAQTPVTPMRRTYSTAGCPFTYGGQQQREVNCGITFGASNPLFSNTWCPASTLPSLPAATYYQAAAWVGDTMYVQAPTTAGAGATTIYRYKWGAGWTTGVPCLTAVAGASLTACNGKLYLLGGGASVTTGGTTVQEYNPATGTWTAKAPMPAALSAHGSVCWGDSVIYVIGGPYTGAGTNLNVHYYRPASNTWGTITNSLPAGQGRRAFAWGISGNKIIISCGYNTTYLKSTYVGTIGSDATQLTWVAAPDAPVALSRPGGVGSNGLFFVVGGDTNLTAVKNNKAYVYHIASNSWLTPIQPNPHPVSNMWSAITAKAINDTIRIFQPGGYDGVAGISFFDVIGCGGVITGVKNIEGKIPANYMLSQNYPNPFNPTTKISFAIPKSGLVSLKVFDMLGREVAILVNDNKAAGTYIVDFDASAFSSGVYFYKLEADGYIATKKMMLVK